MCLCGVGGAAHPDELLGGLTAAQWEEWKIYCRLYPTPIQRNDVNTALIRQSCGNWSKVPKASELLVRYGRRRIKSDEELKNIGMAWAAADAARTAKKA